jgi:hypothetical protein
MRQSADSRRHAGQAADAEADYVECASDPIGLSEEQAERDADELALAAVKAFACGRVNIPDWGALWLWHAQHAVPCSQCHRDIAPEEYFTSIGETPQFALRFALCRRCRPFQMPKGK